MSELIDLVDPNGAIGATGVPRDDARFYTLEELEQKRDSGEFTFVDGFFEDITLALDI